jgi:hypothetical protein
LADARGNQLVESQQAICEVDVPEAHEVVGEFDAVGGFEFPLLAVKGFVIAKFLGMKG